MSLAGRTASRPSSLIRAAVVVALTVGACGAPSGPEPSRRERAYRANNLGVARLEQSLFPEAVAAFRQALAEDDGLASARINLSIALYYAQDLDAARREADLAARRSPTAPQPLYVLGLVARAENREADARTAFEQVRKLDPADVGTRVNLAQLALEARRPREAIELLRPVVAEEPFHLTATYVLGLALTRDGQVDEGQRLIERSQALRQTGYAVSFGTGYLEQGRLAEAVASTGAEPELVDPSPPSASFHAIALDSSGTILGTPMPSPFGRRIAASELADDGRKLAESLGGGLTLLDVDGDGDLDLVAVSAVGQRLWRNDGTAWADTTNGSGLEAVPPGSVPIGVVSADIDNDGDADLFVLRAGRSSLYRNEGRGHFVEITSTAALPDFPYLPGAAAFGDIDHDGDVDLLIAGLADVEATRRRPSTADGWMFPDAFAPAPVQLLRNNGSGVFTDITTGAGLTARAHTVAIVPTDVDNHRDLDLLIVNASEPPALWSNQRDGSFRDISREVGLGGIGRADARVHAAAAGDLNKDDRPDFVFAGTEGATLALSHADGRFTVEPLRAARPGATAIQMVDYDSDGLLDLVTWHESGGQLLRHVGSGWVEHATGADAFREVPARIVARTVAAADLDLDDRQDLIVGGRDGIQLWRNGGESRHRALRVTLEGRVSNRHGIGAKVQMRAGSLTSRVELSAATPAVAAADVVFGLGRRDGGDAVRVLWPSGILQAEVASGSSGGALAAISSPLNIQELDRKPSSCPFLFTWNGERFEFVTDFLGGGELGSWVAPGVRNTPDPMETVRITDRQLRPRNGRLELRVTSELEETLFLDRVQLLAVRHPAAVDIYPNEGMTVPPKPERLHAVRDARPPRHAVDDHGHDVTVRVAERDWVAPDDFQREHIRGYARPHELIIDLRDARGEMPASPAILFTGWTDYAFSSDNLAAHQAGLSSTPPSLAVRTTAGPWRPLPIDLGFPVGRPQTIVMDLSGRLKPGEHDLRVTTSMPVLWDQVLVATAISPRVTSVPLALLTADLRVRGFSAERRHSAGAPFTYDYDRVRVDGGWKAMAGWFTRPGDVLPLLGATDDRFVIARSGDEVALQFDASSLPGPHAGWSWTYLLRADGFSKEMDVNSASPFSVEPWPFHAMTRYPYPDGESFPMTDAHQRDRAEYHTRRVIRALPPLVGTGHRE